MGGLKYILSLCCFVIIGSSKAIHGSRSGRRNNKVSTTKHGLTEWWTGGIQTGTKPCLCIRRVKRGWSRSSRERRTHYGAETTLASTCNGSWMGRIAAIAVHRHSTDTSMIWNSIQRWVLIEKLLLLVGRIHCEKREMAQSVPSWDTAKLGWVWGEKKRDKGTSGRNPFKEKLFGALALSHLHDVVKTWWSLTLVNHSAPIINENIQSYFNFKQLYYYNSSGFGPLGAMDRSRTLVRFQRKSRTVKTPGPTEQARSFFS